MKKLVLSVVACATLAAAPALAADMPVKAPVAPVATVYNWSGFYTASGVGAAWWDIHGLLAFNVFELVHNSRGTRFDYGSMVGAQYQWGNVVLGVEAGYNALFNKDFASTNAPSADCLNNPAFVGLRCSSRVDRIWTFGGRLGLAWDRLMVFGTGGYANGRIASQTSIPALGQILDQTDARHRGSYYGVGFEYFVTKFLFSDLILGAEYQHINLRTGLDISSDGNPNDNRYYRASVDIVRARAVFKWTPAAAVVASY